MAMVNRAKGLRNPDEAAAALACPHCSLPDDQMHSILHCTHPDSHEIRRTIHDTMQQLADALLQDPNVRASPLLVNLIHYVIDSCTSLH